MQDDEIAIRPGIRRGVTPCRDAFALALLGGGFAFGVEKLPRERAAALPARAFGPHEQGFALAVDCDARMFRPVERTERAGLWLPISVREPRELHAPRCFPGGPCSIVRRRDVRAAHRTHADGPRVGKRLAEAAAAIRRDEQRHVALHHGARGAEQHEGVATSVGERGQSAAAARARSRRAKETLNKA